jgi:hypothetical protein
MSEETALIPIEERSVDFYGDEIKGVRVTRTPSGQPEVYVPLRQLCDYLGVSYTGQRERVERDAVLATKLAPIQVTTEGGPQTMQCLPLDYLNGWLFGINASRVKERVRERLIRYQEECYLILRDAFLGPDATRPIQSANEAALLQIREMGLAIARMADQQLELERRTTVFEERLDRAAGFVGQMNRRLTVLERRVAPGASLTEEQAFEIKERVTQIALEMARHDPSKSHFAEIYRSLSLQTQRTSYKDIPQDTYEHAVRFLDDWLQALRSSEEETGQADAGE